VLRLRLSEFGLDPSEPAPIQGVSPDGGLPEIQANLTPPRLHAVDSPHVAASSFVPIVTQKDAHQASASSLIIGSANTRVGPAGRDRTVPVFEITLAMRWVLTARNGLSALACVS